MYEDPEFEQEHDDDDRDEEVRAMDSPLADLNTTTVRRCIGCGSLLAVGVHWADVWLREYGGSRDYNYGVLTYLS